MDIESQPPFSSELDALLESMISKRQLVLWEHYKKGLSSKEIFEETGISIQTVRNHINRWKNTGSIEDQKVEGEPLQSRRKIRRR